jgi:hypothetical protein
MARCMTCTKGKVIPKYSNNPRYEQGRMLKYGGWQNSYAGKTIPLYSNNPRDEQGRILRYGGSCGSKVISAKALRKSNSF